MEPTALLKLVTDKIEASFPGEIISSEVIVDYPVIVLKKGKIRDIVKFLYDDKETSFQYLTSLCGMHFPHDKEREFGMVYQLHNLRTNYRIRLKLFMPASDIQVDSLTPVFSAANWLERETYDFFGFDFKGHPDLRRILNVDDMTYFPMRKEYALEDATREDKDDSMFGR